MKKTGQLDRIDFDLIKLLSADARIPAHELGAKVGLSATPCWSRIKTMQANGVIRSFTIHVDPVKLGYHETVIVQISLENHSDKVVTAFQRGLDDIPEVLEAYLVSGDNDYHLKIAVQSTVDFERLLRGRISKLPGVRQTKSSFVLRRLKEKPLPF